MTWRTGKPSRRGEYLVTDVIYRHACVGTWTPEQGWCIRGRWLGHDAALCWQEVEPLPAQLMDRR